MTDQPTTETGKRMGFALEANGVLLMNRHILAIEAEAKAQESRRADEAERKRDEWMERAHRYHRLTNTLSAIAGELAAFGNHAFICPALVSAVHIVAGIEVEPQECTCGWDKALARYHSLTADDAQEAERE